MRNESVAFLAKKLSLEIDRLSNRMLEPCGITHSQFKVLMFLFRREDVPTKQVDIQSEFSMTNPAVTNIMQSMEEQGLVTRQPNAADKRSKLVVPTERARAMQDELNAVGIRIEERIAAGLDADECSQLTELLKKTISTVTEAPVHA